MPRLSCESDSQIKREQGTSQDSTPAQMLTTIKLKYPLRGVTREHYIEASNYLRQRLPTELTTYILDLAEFWKVTSEKINNEKQPRHYTPLEDPTLIRMPSSGRVRAAVVVGWIKEWPNETFYEFSHLANDLSQHCSFQLDYYPSKDSNAEPCTLPLPIEATLRMEGGKEMKFRYWEALEDCAGEEWKGVRKDWELRVRIDGSYAWNASVHFVEVAIACAYDI